MLKVISIIFSFCLLSALYGQNIEKGIYISYNGGMIQKYSILTVDDDSIQLEVFIKWQGEWLTAWLIENNGQEQSYKPQILNKDENGILSNENSVIERKKHLKGLVKNTFIGRIRFKYSKVQTLPQKYDEVRQKGIEFTNRKK